MSGSKGGCRWISRGVFAGATCCVALVLVLCVGGASALAAQIESQQGFGFTDSARLEAQIAPLGAQTTCHVQYLDQRTLEDKGGWAEAVTVPCSPEDLGSGATAVKAVALVEGLQIDTVYAFRFLASSDGTNVTSTPETFTTFGIEAFSLQATNSEGTPVDRAGEHPYKLTTNILLNTGYASDGQAVLDASLKDVRVELPPGLIGSPAATPKCPQQLLEIQHCPTDTQVGTMAIGLIGDAQKGAVEEPGARPLFNLVPPKGVAARFGAWINGGISAYIDAGLRGGSDYGVDADSLNISEWGEVKRIIVTMWGVPSDPRHDSERFCPAAGEGGFYEQCSAEVQSKPFLSMPTSCTGPLSTVGSVDSYDAVGEWAFGESGLPGMTDCGQVGFAPTFEARPTSRAADSPTGLDVDLHIPQDEGPEGLASADLKDATITFPSGVVVDPSSADGLEACSESQVGFTGFAELDPAGEPGVQTAQFTPGAAECPDASKLGNVQVDTPLLEHPITGGMYLAKQDENPFGSLLAVYLTLYDPISGVVIKVPGLLQANGSTGQLTATFDQNPQLPFEDLKVALFEGSRAALSTPSTCGSYTTSTQLVPWSAPEGGTASPSSSFTVSEGANGSGCVESEGQAGNAPAFEAGMASPVAGSFSPFVLKLAREDGSQRFGVLDVALPAGLIGRVAGVEECPQAGIEAAQRLSGEGQGATELADPSCPAGSELGTVHVGVGSGAPMYVTGHAYFAGPYEGAPFSLVIVTPAVAGPFDLGTVVVRAALFIDPVTAQVSVKSGPLPSILDGIPLDIRSIAVDISREGFMLNPTSCEATTIGGQEQSTIGQTAGLSERFQDGGCTNLPFKPTIAVSTSAKSTRLDGTSVTFKLGYPAGALGREAWLRAAKFEFPKQLSARLSTIQKACAATVFQANPAACPEASRIGIATVKTQLLPVPLMGPVYFVSNGGQKFPEAVFVLQGDGVTVDLHSETFISEKTGITSATLPAIPGVPFEEATVTLPAGPYSEFTAVGSLCKPTSTVTVKRKVTVRVKGRRRKVTKKIKETVATPLEMPTGLIAQNGASISQNTPVAVTGCLKAKTSSKTKKKTKTKKRTKAKSKKPGAEKR